MTWATSPAPEVDDGYLLRGLAWCGLCNLSLVPARLLPGKRFYGCRNLHCEFSSVKVTGKTMPRPASKKGAD